MDRTKFPSVKTLPVVLEPKPHLLQHAVQRAMQRNPRARAALSLRLVLEGLKIGNSIALAEMRCHNTFRMVISVVKKGEDGGHQGTFRGLRPF
eukprot:scaffold184_cov179-Amphora_coffeaeformis.AAC.21